MALPLEREPGAPVVPSPASPAVPVPFAEPAEPGGRDCPLEPARPAPGVDPLPGGRVRLVRPPYARWVASARAGSADEGRAGGRGTAFDGPSPTSCSYAAWIARNRGSAAWPAASGWFSLASWRYARLISSRLAPRLRPSVRYGSVAGVMASLVSLGPSAQPMSSPTGASTNSAIDSAPSRPCGSRIRRPVVAGQRPQRRPVEHAGLAQRLDRCGPRPAVVAVAVLDLDREARSPSPCVVPVRVPGQDRDPAQRLHAGLADAAGPAAAFMSEVSSRSCAAADHLRLGEHRVADRRSAPARARCAGPSPGSRPGSASIA